MEVFCSTIIPTIGRPSLASAIASVLDQDFQPAACEVIVVNDSARPLPDMDWQRCPNVRVIDTDRVERSVARNRGAAIACGRYLHFLDDDDLLLPGALQVLWELAQTSTAPWLYGSYRNVDNVGRVVAEWHPGLKGDVFALLVASESIPLQASLVRASHFRACGGFDPDPALIGVEDRELGRRMALRGFLDFTPAVIAQIRIGRENSTTDWAAIAERDRWGREKALRQRGASQHLRRTTHDSEVCGRVGRAYFSSAVWNLRRRAVRTCIGRVATGLSLIAPHCLSPKCWRGMFTIPP